MLDAASADRDQVLVDLAHPHRVLQKRQRLSWHHPRCCSGLFTGRRISQSADFHPANPLALEALAKALWPLIPGSALALALGS